MICEKISCRPTATKFNNRHLKLIQASKNFWKFSEKGLYMEGLPGEIKISPARPIKKTLKKRVFSIYGQTLKNSFINLIFNVMETNLKSVGINATCKVLGGIHLIGQTVADLALSAEVRLRTTSTVSAADVINYRVNRTMVLQSKVGIANPFESLELQPE